MSPNETLASTGSSLAPDAFAGNGRGCRLRRRDLAALPSIESASDESDCDVFHFRPALTFSGA